jgi:hypothetical protein
MFSFSATTWFRRAEGISELKKNNTMTMKFCRIKTQKKRKAQPTTERSELTNTIEYKFINE